MDMHLKVARPKCINNKATMFEALVRHQYDEFIKWKHFPRYWPFVRGIHRSPVTSLNKGQWRGALMLTLSCAWINGRVKNRKAGDLRRHRAHYDVIVMIGDKQLPESMTVKFTVAYSPRLTSFRWQFYNMRFCDMPRKYKMLDPLKPSYSKTSMVIQPKMLFMSSID